MSFNKKFFTTGGIVASTPSAAAFDPLQNFETVTYTGGSEQKITGYIRKGAAFNGSSSKIDLGSSALKQLPMTISMWLNPITTANGAFYSNYSSSTEGFYCRVQSDGTFLIDAYNGGSNRTLLNNTTGSIPDNTWSHVAITFDSSNVILYINGSETDRVSTNANGIAFTASEPTKLGVRGTSSDWYNGKMDQVRIFKTALNPTQVGQLALETYADPKKSTTDYFGDSSGVALYELDEDANDTGSYPYGTGAIDSGQSAVFNGSSSTIATSAKIPSSLDFSFSFWFNTTSTYTNGYLFSTKENYQTNGYYIMANNGVVQYGEGNGSTNATTQYSTTTDLNDGNWHHCVVTRAAGGTLNMYIDNIREVNNASLGSGYMTSSNWHNNLQIGKYSGAQDLYYNGKLDQVRIYNTVLSASDVEALVSETNVPTANLVAHYKLDGNANDETTNYNGTPTSITYSDPAEFPLIAYNGTPTNINFLGMAFQPDLVWIKSRGGSYPHILFDSVRGIDQPNDYYLQTNATSAEVTTTDRFTLNGNSMTIPVGSNVINSSAGSPYVMWLWKAGGAAVLNENGSIDSQVSANPDAGFSIVKYTSNGSYTSSDTIGHGLSQKPELVIWKPYETTTSDWFVQYELVDGSVDYLILNESDAKRDAASTYLFQDNILVNFAGANGQDTIAYCFHSVDGYQKVGSYTGTNAAGNVIYTTDDGTPSGSGGFRPRFLLTKRYSADGGGWNIFDSVRGTNKRLYPHLSNEEGTSSPEIVTFNSNGFTFNTADSWNNGNYSYIYLAIA